MNSYMHLLNFGYYVTDLQKPSTCHIFECSYSKDDYLENAIHYLNETLVIYTGGVAAGNEGFQPYC